ncbi:MAG: sensor domain-containing phosphodiesterase [Firmicutes bacterium]|nr:sensor domain-containing phosphodiesterase [Bacillota bacterium]
MKRKEAMDTMNRIFRRAFERITEKESMEELLECIGEELCCDRVSIFELHEDGFYDNTFEWCREGVLSEHDFLQHLPFSGLSLWRQTIETGRMVVIPDLEALKEEQPRLYRLFHEQSIQSMILCGLQFHGRDKGFVILENPSSEVADQAEQLMPVFRYILSALLHTEHLMHRLEQTGYSDSLTGAGNRLSLQNHLEKLNREESLGLLYCDAVDWIREDGALEHLDHDQLVIHTGSILQTVFEEELVFRVGAGEFLALCPGMSRDGFQNEVRRLRTLFLEQDLSVAAGILWRDRAGTDYDSMIQQAHLKMYDERQDILRIKKEQAPRSDALPEAGEGQARISLYRESEYFHRADEWLAQIYDQDVLTLHMDINYFRLYNDIFGREAGNLFLEHIADWMACLAHRYNGICGYLGGDNFILMLPIPRGYEESLISDRLDQHLNDMTFSEGFTPVFGVYISRNRQENAITLYDRALFARSEIRGSSSSRYAIYSADHFAHEKQDKLLLIDVKRGLKNGEFSFMVQPQVRLSTGSIIGSEALVRWRRPDETRSTQYLVNLLEKSGHIHEVDQIVWEEVFRWQRSQLDRGKRVLPCSVNVSRKDFFFLDVAAEFQRLSRTYRVDPSLVSAEITESAFTDNLEVIQTAIRKLHEAGFRICMDDFGSGVSSLSMLHRMNVDVIKTDVAFMSRLQPDNRSMCIVESVINMAHLIRVSVITEGVETEAQAEALRSMRDHHAQGYYFYEPMETEDFEDLLQTTGGEELPEKENAVRISRLSFRDMVQEGLLSDTLLESIIGPAAVIRRRGDEMEFVQVNEAYSRLTGIERPHTDLREKYLVDFADGSYQEVLEAFREADENPLDEAMVIRRYVRPDGQQCELKTRLFPLYAASSERLYLSLVQE